MAKLVVKKWRIVVLDEFEGIGAFIERVRWEVNMKFGEKLHLKLAREAQYISHLSW